MIYKCLNLFNLLPTSQPHLWLIAADWLEEEGLDITAVSFREGIFRLEVNNGGGYSYYGGSGLLIDECDNIYDASRGIACGKSDGKSDGKGDGKGSDEWRHYLSYGWVFRLW